MFKKSMLVAALALSSTAALAVPQPVQKAIDSGNAKLEKEFDAGSGLKGYVVKVGAEYQVLYSTSDDKVLITGQLVSAEGASLTEVHTDKFVPKPDYSEAFKKAEKIGMSVKMNAKAKGPVVYIVADANCSFCHFVDEAFRPYADTGKVDVRVLHVSFLRPDSATKAAAIMTAKDPSKALKEHADKFNGGGITPVDASAEVKKSLDEAAALMSELQAGGTPTIIYKNKDGKVEVVKGMPNLSKVAEIARMPKIENKNSKLTRFDR